MAGSWLLDTSALLAHHRRETGWERVQAIFDDEGAEIRIASVTLTEFARRLRDLGAGEEVVERTLGDYEFLCTEVVGIDPVIARAAFRIGSSSPHRLPLVDSLIAAVAQARGATLVHRHRHMAAIPSSLLSLQDLDIARSTAKDD